MKLQYKKLVRRHTNHITAWCVALLAENDNLKFNFLERPGMLQRSAALEMLLKTRSIFRHAGICREQRNYCSEFAGAAPTHLSNMAINRVPDSKWHAQYIKKKAHFTHEALVWP